MNDNKLCKTDTIVSNSADGYKWRENKENEN